MHPDPSTEFDDLDDLDEPEPQPPVPPVWPTVTELCAAMAGTVPEQHPARTILLGARMLTTVPEWVNPDEVVVCDENDTGTGHYGYEYAGSEVLDEIGIANINDSVRIVIIDRINHAADGWHRDRVGHAIDAIARARWEWRRASRPDIRTAHEPRIQQWIIKARRQVVAAQRDYRMLVNGRAWIDGPEPRPRDW